MARKQTLSKLLTDLRAETGASLAPSHNIQQRGADVNLLQRIQSDLYEDFNWPHLRVTRNIPAQSGQRYYDPPEDMLIDKIERIDLLADGRWQPLWQGVDDSNYCSFNSDKDERSWPPSHWRIYEDEQIEIWPIPDQDGNETTLHGMLRFTGIRPLRPLIEDIDTCDLDSTLIVLFAAAERLAVKDKDRAKLALSRANRRKLRLQGSMVVTEPHRVFGVKPAPPSRMEFIGTYRPPYNV